MSISDLMHDEITWINHAGYQLRTGHIRLVCDPWLTGAVFDRGWDLLVPTCFSATELGNATHIWLSHEHPDHFSPTDLRSIDPAQRAKITILYQRTRDRRVVSFCEGLGFKVQELEPGLPFDLGPGVRGIIGIVESDSWLHIETPSHAYLNLNDCVLARPEHYEAIRRASVRPPDVLFAQFSYANWAGNRGDKQSMMVHAANKISELRRNIAHIAPRFFVPFASFVFFSHEENFHLNEGSNTIDHIFDLFDAPECPCIVLYPGDIWAPGGLHDSASRVALYTVARTAIEPRHERHPVSLDELQRLASNCVQRLSRNNQRWAVRLLELTRAVAPLVVRLEDLNTTILYRPYQKLIVVDEAAADISCSADAFAQCLRADYGCGTLQVNGRFQIERQNGLMRLRRAFAINSYNNRGIDFPWGLSAMRLQAMGMSVLRPRAGWRARRTAPLGSMSQPRC